MCDGSRALHVFKDPPLIILTRFNDSSFSSAFMHSLLSAICHHLTCSGFTLKLSLL